MNALTESIAAALLAATILAGAALGMTTLTHPWIVAGVPFFLFAAWLLRLPSWACGLVVALPVAALLAGQGTLQAYDLIFEWQAITVVAAVIVLLLGRKRLPEIMPPVGLLLTGLLPVMLCGIGALFVAARHYGWGYGQVAETALPVLQAVVFVLATTAVCARRLNRIIILLVLFAAAIVAGL